VQLAGSPVHLIMELLYNDKNLPQGAAAHLATATPEVKEKLINLFEEFKYIFPAKLPLTVPPNRGVGDEHVISVEPGSKIPARPPYR